MYRKILLLIVVISCAMILPGCSAKQNSSSVNLIEKGKTMSNTNPTSKPATQSASPPEMEIDTSRNYTAIIKTELGDITIALNVKETPITVNNFIHLARKNFYDNTVFHRTIKGFMIQGGDPKGDGTGGPGYKFADEPFEGEYTRGTVAMANSGPNTNGSQFFIMHQDQELEKKYVIFGKVIEGMEVVDKIANAPIKQNPYTGEMSVPVNPVKVNTIEIIEK